MVANGDMNRKTNKAKLVDKSCGNHGSCPWCRGSRTHANRVRRLGAEEQLRDHEQDRWRSMHDTFQIMGIEEDQILWSIANGIADWTGSEP